MPTAWCSTTPSRATTSLSRWRTLRLASRRLSPTLHWMPRAGLSAAMRSRRVPVQMPAPPFPALPTPSPMRLSSCIPRRWACAWAPARIRRAIRTATRQLPRRCMPSPRTVPPRHTCPWTRLAMMPSRMARRWPMRTWPPLSPPATPWRWAQRSMPPASGSSRWVPMSCPPRAPKRWRVCGA